MTDYARCSRLQVATPLLQFIDQEVLPGTSLARDSFWESLDELLGELMPLHHSLMLERRRLQQALDDQKNLARPQDASLTWLAFAECHGCLSAPPGVVRISTAGVDRELSDLAGPQLLVPAADSRALNGAIKARWGSLYQALYHHDAGDPQSDHQSDQPYDPQRAARVVVQVRELLDQFVPLASGSHIDARHYRVRNGQLSITLACGEQTGLQRAEQFLGHQGESLQPTAILFGHHGLHIDIRIDIRSLSGGCDVAGISDVQLEAALSVMIDLNSATDAAEPLAGYRNCLKLVQTQRSLYQDRSYHAASGGELKLPGRALQLLLGHDLKTSGHLLLSRQDREAPRLILDAVLAGLFALHERHQCGNSRTGSLYLNVPGLQGPQEVAFVERLLGRIETLLDLPMHSLKLGLSDEHWRTCLNLEACIQAAPSRIAVLHGGALRASTTTATPWQQIAAQRTIAVALACGLRGRAQIGQGASSDLVTTPLAATLQALHYHRVNVQEVHKVIEQDNLPQRCKELLEALLCQPAQADQ